MIEKYIGEHPVKWRTFQMLYAVTDPSGKQVEKLYILESSKPNTIDNQNNANV